MRHRWTPDGPDELRCVHCGVMVQMSGLTTGVRPASPFRVVRRHGVESRSASFMPCDYVSRLRKRLKQVVNELPSGTAAEVVATSP